MEQEIGIRDLIDRVKADLLAQPPQGTPMFIINGVQLEISFTIQKKGGGGFSLKVLDTGFEANVGGEHTTAHKITVDLLPVTDVESARKKLSESLGGAAVFSLTTARAADDKPAQGLENKDWLSGLYV